MQTNPSSGHAPGLPTVTRRSLLRASPAFAIGSLPAAALAAPDTPVMRLYREHETMVARAEAEPDPWECGRLCGLASDIADRMAEEPATTMLDLAAKVATLTNCDDEMEYPWTASVVADCHAILGRAGE